MQCLVKTPTALPTFAPTKMPTATPTNMLLAGHECSKPRPHFKVLINKHVVFSIQQALDGSIYHVDFVKILINVTVFVNTTQYIGIVKSMFQMCDEFPLEFRCFMNWVESFMFMLRRANTFRFTTSDTRHFRLFF